jgi:hypothetical protein
MDYLAKQRNGATVEYFVPYPAYKTGGLLELMKSILDEAKAK